MSQNSITVIKPYKWEGQWVFDDDRVGLDKEPFVAGADTLIDLAIERQGITNAKDGFLMLFSVTPLPSERPIRSVHPMLSSCRVKAASQLI